MKPLRILIVSAEITPYAKTGGLADVSAALGRALARAGHDVRLLMPLYERVAARGTIAFTPRLAGLRTTLGSRNFTYSIGSAPLPKSETEVHFLASNELYGRPGIYTQDADEPVRFAFLSRTALEFCQHLGWAPDVIHLNDWHTGLLPLYLRTQFRWDRLFERTRTLLTLHNIGYQGSFGADVLEQVSLADQRSFVHQERLREGRVGFLETGILYADALSTVSETYAREIQTSEFGMGLEELLRARADHLHGIVNGIDDEEWNPATDPHLARPYSAADLSGKEANKRALMDDFGLPFDAGAAVFGIVSRLTAQKGFDLLPDVLPVVLRESDVRLVVLGSGEERYESYFQWLRDTFPTRVGIYRGYDERLAHRIEGGSDLFLMPSRYEPCGLNQMYSLRYGTVPIVRRTGGLADTVEPFDLASRKGTGFLFTEFRSEALLHAMREALRCWRDRSAWRRLVRNGMARDFSWNHQVARYVELYRSLVAVQ
jgi:starch synthase